MSKLIAHRANFCQIFSCWVKGKFLNDQLYTDLVLATKFCLFKHSQYIIQILGILGNFAKALSNVSFKLVYYLDRTDLGAQNSVYSFKYICHILYEFGKKLSALSKSYFLSGQGNNLCALRVLAQATIEYLEASSP